MENRKSGPLIVFLASLLWASDGPFRKPLFVGGLSVPFVSFLEHVLNAVVSLPGLWKTRGYFKQLTAKQVCALLYIGAGASALASLLFFYGSVAMNYNFTVAALLQKVQPIFAIILAAIFLKEKISIRFWLLGLPAIFGAYLVSFGAVSPMDLFAQAGSVSLKGPLFAILAALLWAGGTVVGRGLLGNLDFKFVTGMRFLFGFLFLSIFLLFTGGAQFSLLTWVFWKNIIIIAMVTGFFALSLYYYGLKNTKASVATLMELGYPLALTAINWKFLGIVLSAWQIMGAMILLICVTLLVINSGKENLY